MERRLRESVDLVHLAPFVDEAGDELEAAVLGAVVEDGVLAETYIKSVLETFGKMIFEFGGISIYLGRTCRPPCRART